MGLFDFLRRTSSAPQPPHHPGPEALRAQDEPQLRDAQAESQPTPLDPLDWQAVELRVRAERVQRELTRALDRENTPAHHAGYDVAEHVMLSEISPGRLSSEIEDDLARLVLQRPDAFTGTEFVMSEAQREQMSAELLAQPGDGERGEGGPDEGAAGGAVEDPRWARAMELQAEFNRAMTLENTPAAFVGDEYSYDDDVWCDDLYATPGSQRVEEELHAHVRAHPDLFAGTEFQRSAERAAQAAELARAQQANRGQREHTESERELDESDAEIDEEEPPF